MVYGIVLRTFLIPLLTTDYPKLVDRSILGYRLVARSNKTADADIIYFFNIKSLVYIYIKLTQRARAHARARSRSRRHARRYI